MSGLRLKHLRERRVEVVVLGGPGHVGMGCRLLPGVFPTDEWGRRGK